MRSFTTFTRLIDIRGGEYHYAGSTFSFTGEQVVRWTMIYMELRHGGIYHNTIDKTVYLQLLSYHIA